jgi:AhpD family alkylhydroperoxidase
MPSHVKAIEESKARSAVLKEGSVQVMDLFMQTHANVLRDNVLSFKTKELVAIGISIAIRCTCCLDHHVALAIEAGATREEVIEAIEVAILIGGGPSTHYGALALEAYDELKAASESKSSVNK